jgi:hypothetical protein
MKEVGEIELAIQGQTEEIEQLGRQSPLNSFFRPLTLFHLTLTGEAGKVEESMAKLEAVEALKSEKAEKEVSHTSCSYYRSILNHISPFQRELQRLSETGGASGHQKLRVCETCGAYLSVLDSDRRLADHFGGKVSHICGHQRYI